MRRLHDATAEPLGYGHGDGVSKLTIAGAVALAFGVAIGEPLEPLTLDGGKAANTEGAANLTAVRPAAAAGIRQGVS